MSLARNTIYNIVGAAAPAAISLVTIPLYLQLVGLERYGLVAIFWLLVGYFGLFDFGVGRATAQQLAKLGDSSAAERSRAFWTGASISIALAVIAIVIAIVFLPFALGFMDVNRSALKSETWQSLPYLVIAIPIAIVQSVLRGALEGRREFLTVNALFTLAAVGTAALPLVAAKLWGPQLQHLVAASVVARVALLAALVVACVLKVPITRYELPQRREVNSTLRFGAWLTVTNVVGPLMVISDRFMIGASLGPREVALYVIPFNLVNQLLLLPAALGNALFPTLAASKPNAGLNRRALFGANLFVSILSLFAVVLIGPFLRLWIGGPTANDSTEIALVLIVGGWANALAQIPHVSIQAAGRTDVTAKIHLAEVAPYLLLLWFALSRMGVIGAAVVWSIRAIVDFVALSWFDGIRGIALGRTLMSGVPVLALTLLALAARGRYENDWVVLLPFAFGTAIWLCSTVPPEVLRRIASFVR